MSNELRGLGICNWRLWRRYLNQKLEPRRAQRESARSRLMARRSRLGYALVLAAVSALGGGGGAARS